MMVAAVMVAAILMTAAIVAIVAHVFRIAFAILAHLFRVTSCVALWAVLARWFRVTFCAVGPQPTTAHVFLRVLDRVSIPGEMEGFEGPAGRRGGSTEGGRCSGRSGA